MRTRRWLASFALAVASLVTLGGCAAGSGAGAGGQDGGGGPAGQPSGQPSGSAAAAGSGRDAGGDPTKLDPCKLVSREEVEKALGFGVALVKPEPPVGPARMCGFYRDREGIVTFVVGVIDVTKTKARFTSDMATAERMLGMKGQPVPGVGDAAIWLGDIGELDVLAGGIQFQFSYLAAATEGRLAPGLRDLAVEVAGRI